MIHESLFISILRKAVYIFLSFLSLYLIFGFSGKFDFGRFAFVSRNEIDESGLFVGFFSSNLYSK